jgi:hypothetical protein
LGKKEKEDREGLNRKKRGEELKRLTDWLKQRGKKPFFSVFTHL